METETVSTFHNIFFAHVEYPKNDKHAYVCTKKFIQANQLQNTDISPNR